MRACIFQTFSKNNKMLSHIGYRMKVTMQDSRTFIGIFKGEDVNTWL